MNRRFLHVCIAAITSTACVAAAAPLAAQSDSTERRDTTNSPDSTSLLDRMTLHAGGANYYHMLPGGRPRVTIDPYLRDANREDRRLGELNLPDFVGDSPLYHGAAYLSVGATFRPFDGFSVWGELVGEYRGSSYGINDTRNTVVLPRILFTFDTTVTLFGQEFGAGLSVGHLIDLRFGEGLMLYNMDALGTLVWFDWWKLRYYYEKIGDGAYSIGLNVDDFNQDGIELRDLELTDGVLLGARLGGWAHPQLAATRYPDIGPRARLLREAALKEHGYDAALSLRVLDSLHVYTEAGLRYADNSDHLMSRTALVAGVSYAMKNDELTLRTTGEYRYYGGLFNAGFANTGVEYQSDGTGAPGVGRFVYPLDRLERPFSQWAVFTEYQNLKDVTGYTLRGHAKLFFWKRFMARCDIDLNFIQAEGTDGQLYPFVDVGVGWEPVDNTSVVLSMTNRGMNLDRSYPTLYLYDGFRPSATLRWNR